MPMERRTFLGGLTGFFAYAGGAGLPLVAREFDPQVFAKRGEWERLNINSIVLKLGATSPFSVLHISDTHLATAYLHESAAKQYLAKVRDEQFGGRQEEALRDSLDWAKTHVDYVIHTGDLIDFQSEANYDLVKKYLGANVLGTMGNHEYSPEMWLTKPAPSNNEAWKDRYREKLASVYPFDVTFSSKVVNGVNFVMLDDVFGTVTAGQVERFGKEVAKGLPIVLCLHVPFYTDNIATANSHYWLKNGGPFRSAQTPDPSGDWKSQLSDATTSDFIAYLKGEPLLKAILAGHLHINIQDRFSPTAMEYVVGGNYMFAGQELLIS